MKKVAILLCGSGFKDGSEIRESVGVLWALSAHGVQADMYAPDLPQHDVINCLTLAPMGESRNMLVEAARIARGKVRPISDLIVDQYAALFIPGGFGVAKNLCTFAFQGAKGTVVPEVKSMLTQFHERQKPIGAVCIAPALVALTFSQKSLELTVGAVGEASQEIEKLGHRHRVVEASACHVDKSNRIVSTPAYMYDKASLHDIFEGIRKLVAETLAFT